MLTLLLLSCFDYGFFDEGQEPTAPPPADSDPQDSAPPPEEICNGVDDDNDGRVDEGSPDVDEDGVADCVDQTCEVETPPSGPLSPNEDCDGWVPESKTESPWAVEIESYSNNGPGAFSLGAVADTNGDGAIDRGDQVNITWPQNKNCIASTTDGNCLVPGSKLDVNIGTVLADTDGDGQVDYLLGTRLLDASGDYIQLVLLDSAGDTIWRGIPSANHYQCLRPEVLDIDGDGVPEVLDLDHVLDGRTGEIKWSYNLDYPDEGGCPSAADLDGDGTQEVIVGTRVFNHDGSTRFDAASAFVQVAFAWDVDGDGDGEVLVSNGAYLDVYQDDGSLTDELYIGQQLIVPPCIADYDGDGIPELGLVLVDQIQVREFTGKLLWKLARSGSDVQASNAWWDSCAAADLDGDGAFEFLPLTDGSETLDLYIGSTGEVLLTLAAPEEWGGASSGRLASWGGIAIADVDNDSSVEIVVNGYGLVVYGHPDNGWTEGTASWRSNQMTLSNPLPDGSIPAHPDTPWADGLWRAQRQAEVMGGADLVVANLDVCVASCEGEGSRVVFQLGNAGPLPTTGVEVAIIGVHSETGERTELHRFSDLSVAPHTLAEPLEWSTHAYFLWDQQIEVVVDPDGQIKECAESNNTATWSQVFCESPE